jgi:hypothetical protein
MAQTVLHVIMLVPERIQPHWMELWSLAQGVLGAGWWFGAKHFRAAGAWMPAVFAMGAFMLGVISAGHMRLDLMADHLGHHRHEDDDDDDAEGVCRGCSRTCRKTCITLGSLAQGAAAILSAFLYLILQSTHSSPSETPAPTAAV